MEASAAWTSGSGEVVPVHTHEVEVDIAKAYDTARWPQVAAAMAAIGAPAAYIRLRAKMFSIARAQVLSHAGLTPSIAQDSLLSLQLRAQCFLHAS